MNKTDYNSKAELLVKIIDIAIDSFKSYPPPFFEQRHIQQFINTYLDFKDKVINPEVQFRNLTSLKYITNDVLTYFQEGSGKAVDHFWKQITQKNLGVVRINRFEKILQRGRIKDKVEYDIITDLYNSYVETNMLSPIELNKINDLISEFEIGRPS